MSQEADFHLSMNSEHLISIVERALYECSAVTPATGVKHVDHILPQNHSMIIHFLSPTVYLFYALISEYIEKLNSTFHKKTGEIETF